VTPDIELLLKPLEVPLNAVGEKGVERFPTAAIILWGVERACMLRIANRQIH
jgi:hypothetical protein